MHWVKRWKFCWVSFVAPKLLWNGLPSPLHFKIYLPPLCLIRPLICKFFHLPSSSLFSILKSLICNWGVQNMLWIQCMYQSAQENSNLNQFLHFICSWKTFMLKRCRIWKLIQFLSWNVFLMIKVTSLKMVLLGEVNINFKQCVLNMHNYLCHSFRCYVFIFPYILSGAWWKY